MALNPVRLRPIRMGSNFFICIPCCEAFSAGLILRKIPLIVSILPP